jgi:hypothetical protein
MVAELQRLHRVEQFVGNVFSFTGAYVITKAGLMVVGPLFPFRCMGLIIPVNSETTNFREY